MAIGALLLAWVLRDFDLGELQGVLESAEIWPLLLLPLATVAEQLLRALKWRQMLHPLRSVAVWRLFGAIMVGYFANLVTLVRVSPLVRAWLIARVEALSTSTLLATVVLDRLIDGLVFVGLTTLALVIAQFPDTTGTVWTALAWGAFVSLVLVCGLILGLVSLRRFLGQDSGARWLVRFARRLPRRWRDPLSDSIRRFFEGVMWPTEAWRGIMIVAASVAIKLVAISYFVWAGLAFQVTLAPQDYLFLMVFLGFLVVLAGTLGLMGGFTAGAVFVLKGFGVGVEPALAMTLVVQAATMLTVATTGAAALWLQGYTLAAVLQAGKGAPPPDRANQPNGPSEN